MNQQELIEKAKEYARRGFSVIPVKKDKHPAVDSWKEFQTRAALEDEIEKMFARPDAVGIAVITGVVSDVVVLDCEAKADPAFLLNIPVTLTARTGGGGHHFYFRNPTGRTIPNRTRFLPEMDFRGECGYAILPPSEHASGKKYEWINESIEIAELPDWLEEKVRDTAPLATSSAPTATTTRFSILGVKEGERNNRMTSLIGTLFTKHPRSPSLVADLAKAVNETYDPPLPPGELKTIFHSIRTREEKKHPKSKFAPIPLAELLAKAPKEIQWLIEGVIPRGTINVLSAPPGSFKTWTLLHTAMQVARGMPVFGRFPTKKGKVLIIDEENQEDLLGVRFRNLGAENSLEITTSSLIGFKIDKPEDIEELKSYIAKNQIDLVIFDSLVRVNSKDENDARQVAEVFNAFKSLTKDGTTVLMTHHHRKQAALGRNILSESLRGSSDILAAVDTHLIVERNPSDPQSLIFSQNKMRQGEPIRPFEVRIASSKDSFALSFESEIAAIVLGRERAKEEIVAYLGDAGSVTRSWIDSRLKDFGKTNIGKALKDLEREKVIGVTKGPKGKKSYWLQPQPPLDLGEASDS